jgi:hypothetical protein
MKPLYWALGVVLVWVIPGPVARAKTHRICVDVKIRSYKSLLRKKPTGPKTRPGKGGSKGVSASAGIAPEPARPRPRPRQPVQPGAGSAAGSAPAARPSKEARAWTNPLERKKIKRKIYRQGFRAGGRAMGRKWQAHLSGTFNRRYPYPPAAYLRRLVEHYVTHAKGFVAASDRCDERIIIEMYPIKGGWTVFARNSKRAREEKVDLVSYEELTRLAQRVVIALLQGQHIAATANLRTVLSADSIRSYRTIKGSHHFTFTLGTAFKLAWLPTYSDGGVSNRVRPLAPMTFSMGYRGRFNAWGIDAFMRGGIGMQRESALRNTEGGHVDCNGLWSIGLRFLRYTSPHGMMSIYYGAGALFDLTMFSVIKPELQRSGGDRTLLTGGGLNLNFVLGVEFMRASPAQFFLQLVVSAPVYPMELATDTVAIKTYIPEIAATVGIMF